MLPLLLYAFVLCVNALAGDVFVGSLPIAINELLVLFVTSSLALYCTNTRDFSFSHSLLIIICIILAIELIASIIVAETNPGIIRGLNAIAKEEGDVAIMYEYYKLGILDYSMAHAIPILIPPLICHFKEGSIKNKIVVFSLIFFCLWLAWLSESSTAILLIVLMIFVGVMVDGKATINKQLVIIAVMVVFTIAVMNSEYLLTGVFDVTSSLVGDDTLYSEKVEELRYSILENQATGDLETRMDKYKESLGLIIDNPLFGTNKMPGRHSSLLDKFATLGLVGIIPLVLFFFMYLKKIMTTIPNNRKFYYLECIISAFLMLLFKGMWVWPIFLFLFMVSPCLLVINRDRSNRPFD